MKKMLFAALAAVLLLCLAACEEERTVKTEPQTEPELRDVKTEVREELVTAVTEEGAVSNNENVLESREEVPSPSIAVGTYASTDPSRPLDSFTVESVEGNEVAFSVSFEEGVIGYAVAAFTGDVGEFVWSDEGGYQFAEGTILLLGEGRLRLNLVNNNVTASETGVYEFVVY